MDSFQKIADKLSSVAADHQKQLNDAILSSRNPATKYGLAIIGALVLISLIIEAFYHIIARDPSAQLISDTKFFGLLIIGVILIGLGHWMAVDERRIKERNAQRALEMRKLDLEHVRILEEIDLQKRKALPESTPFKPERDDVPGA